MSDKQFKEYQDVVESNEEITDLAYRRIHRKLERKKRQHELKLERLGSDDSNNCSQQ